MQTVELLLQLFILLPEFLSGYFFSFILRFLGEIDLFLERKTIGGEVSGDLKEKYKNAK